MAAVLAIADMVAEDSMAVAARIKVVTAVVATVKIEAANAGAAAEVLSLGEMDGLTPGVVAAEDSIPVISITDITNIVKKTAKKRTETIAATEIFALTKLCVTIGNADVRETNIITGTGNSTAFITENETEMTMTEDKQRKQKSSSYKLQRALTYII